MISTDCEFARMHGKEKRIMETVILLMGSVLHYEFVVAMPDKFIRDA
jgi:hypothetical protein